MAAWIEMVSGESGWELAKPLEGIVYPPEIATTWVGKDIVWANAVQHIIVREAKGAPVIAHTSAFVREAEWDGLPVTIGGIGAVMTHPDHRRQGHARAAIKRALTYLHDEPKVAFALLFVLPHNVAFYANQGWRQFQGDVIAKQPSGTGPFTTLLTMTLGVRQAGAATRGKIDLRGLPW
jgi:aminoglycoside 2'-N-acetyltransferase I